MSLPSQKPPISGHCTMAHAWRTAESGSLATRGLTEALWNKVREENLIAKFRIVYFAESAGGGTHIWAWRTPGLSIEEDIQKLASRLGVSYDSHVTDLARCCFMVSEVLHWRNVLRSTKSHS